MDVLAAIAFGGIVARALSAKNVTNPQKIIQYTISAGFVSVILLACLYFALFYLGATSDAVGTRCNKWWTNFLSLCEQFIRYGGNLDHGRYHYFSKFNHVSGRNQCLW